MNAQYRIQQWFEGLESGRQMSREDVCFLMVQSRHLIDTAENPLDYRVVAFYADWTVHTAIDRSPVCFEVLRDITFAVAANMNPTRPDFTREISRLIGFPRLRAELKQLFGAYHLPTIIFDYRDNWRGFVQFLLWFVAGQPIMFPDTSKGKAKEIQDEILATYRPHNVYVSALAIVENNGVYNWMLQLRGDKDLRMIGQVEVAEEHDAFLPPPTVTPEGAG